jgi:hypothetical protein
MSAVWSLTWVKRTSLGKLNSVEIATHLGHWLSKQPSVMVGPGVWSAPRRPAGSRRRVFLSII